MHSLTKAAIVCYCLSLLCLIISTQSPGAINAVIGIGLVAIAMTVLRILEWFD